ALDARITALTAMSSLVCPTGYSRVGPAGARGSFCVQQQQHAPMDFFGAVTECWATPTSTGDKAHLCSLNEWYLACSQGVDVGEVTLANIKSSLEWFDQVTFAYPGPAGYNTAYQIGAGSCSSLLGTGISGGTTAYRCCL